MKAMTSPAAMVIASVELVNAMSMVPIPGRVMSGRSTILWISNCCIGSAMPPRTPSNVFVVRAEILGRTPLPGGLDAHLPRRTDGQPDGDDEAHQDPDDHSEGTRLGEPIDRRAESQSHEDTAQEQADQTIAVAMRLGAVVTRRLGRARFQRAGPLLEASDRLFARLFRGRHARSSKRPRRRRRGWWLRKSRGTYRACNRASRLGR